MKVIRDLRRQADEAGAAGTTEISNDKLENILLNSIYMLFLGYESARHSVQRLVEYEPAHVENTIVILLTEIVAFNILIEYFEIIDTEQDFRYERLKMRESDYEAQVKMLKEEINKYYSVANLRRRTHRRDGDWMKAGKLWPELLRRFADANINAPELDQSTLEALGPFYPKPPVEVSRP